VNRDTWTTVALVLQAFALALIALEAVFVVAALASAPNVYYLALLAGLGLLLWLGVPALRAWRRGGPPGRLYVVDGAVLVFIVGAAEPGVFQTPLGLALGAAFATPALALFIAGRRPPDDGPTGGPRPRIGSRRPW
jgi:hypothetical protein